MRTLLLSFATILLFTYLRAQTNGRPILQFQSYLVNLTVTKQENLILSTRAGEVAIADSIFGDWRQINPVGSKQVGMPGVIIDNANFFNKDTGFVSGFISNNGQYNIIYKTEDGGRNWTPVDFGQSGWVDKAVNLD